jgi:hypothetical protein
MWPAFNIVMRIVNTLFGIAMTLMGIVWILQGLNLAFRVGFMVGDFQPAVDLLAAAARFTSPTIRPRNPPDSDRQVQSCQLRPESVGIDLYQSRSLALLF